MKALSIRQPWAELVMRGEKTLDVRTWQVAYRGPLAIHASSARRPARIRELGLDPDALAYGAILGWVDLVEIIPLDEATYNALRSEHRSDKPFPGGVLYGWRFANPRRLSQPVPTRGRMSLFHVDDALFAEDALAIPEPNEREKREQKNEMPAPPPDPDHPFVLYSRPDGGNAYRISLYQWLSQANGRGEQRAARDRFWKIEMAGDALRMTADALLRTLQANGYRATDLSRRLEKPFFLDEPSGLRLALIFLAVKPVSRHDRVEAIVNGILAMSDEEAYYWFSKCSRGPSAQRAQRALRVLLAAE